MVKLDIDTSPIENRLVRQLRDDPKLLHIVDVFYFEDHLLQKELSSAWGSSAEESHTSKQSIVVCQYNVGTSSIALRTGSCDAYICSIVQSCSQPADFDTSELDVNNFDMYVFERWCVGYNGSESPAVSSPSGSAPTLSPKEESSYNSLESKLTSSPTLQTLPLSGDISASCAMMQSVWLGVVLLASTAANVV
eukprot:scaffold5170_cov200-Alexandrium_tamarense.AAC.11